jgi:hypothetical protein
MSATRQHSSRNSKSVFNDAIYLKEGLAFIQMADESDTDMATPFSCTRKMIEMLDVFP